MKYEECTTVYSCCGQYIAPTKAVKDCTIKCPRCGKKQTNPIKVPMILIVKAT